LGEGVGIGADAGGVTGGGFFPARAIAAATCAWISAANCAPVTPGGGAAPLDAERGSILVGAKPG